MSYPRQEINNPVRQTDDPPGYNAVMPDSENYVYPVIPGSTQIYPVANPLPQINTIYSPTPPPINYTNTTHVSRYKHKISNNKFFKIGAFIASFLVIAAIIGLLALVIYVVKNANTEESAKSSSAGAICPEGFSITDCSLECGVYFGTNSYNRIVGGQVSASNTWPSMALIIFRYSAYINIGGSTYQISSSTMCGGTLIDKSTILSAAHCIKNSIEYTHNGQTYNYAIQTNSFYPTMASMYTIYLGAHDRSDLNANGIATKAVSKIIKHSEYDSYNTLNDIALFKLESDVVLSEKIQVACLPSSKSSTFPGTGTGYATGWGNLASGGSSSTVLREVDLSIYNGNLCANVARGYEKDWDSQICAGDYSGNKDTCQGDSGGPLFILDTVDGKQKFVTVGITSYGVGCAEVATPAIYTRTSYYYDWIRNNNSTKTCMNIYMLIGCVLLAILQIQRR